MGSPKPTNGFQSGREPARVKLVEAYAKAQGLWRDDTTPDPVFTDTLSLDLSTVEPSLAGPRRPQDRVPLADAKSAFIEALGTFGVDFDNGSYDTRGLANRMARVDHEQDPLRNDRRIVWLDQHAPNCRHGRPAHRDGRLDHFGNNLRSARHGVAAHIHRGPAGVVVTPLDLHEVMAQAGDPINDACRQPPFFEDRPLLDVQFDVGVDVGSLRRRDCRRLQAHGPHGLSHRDPVVIEQRLGLAPVDSADDRP